jgi:hypothetical protein
VKKLSLAMILVGVGLVVYAVMNFSAVTDNVPSLSTVPGRAYAYAYYYDVWARLEAVAGSVLALAGFLLRNNPK